MNTLVALFMYSSLAITTYNLDCTMPNGSPVKIAVKDGQIQELTIEAYTVIRGGKQLSDQEIGRQVFDVKVDGPHIRRNGRQSIKLSLQEYSDKQSWRILISKGGRKATLNKYYQSSDGDGLPHHSRIKLTCQN